MDIWKFLSVVLALFALSVSANATDYYVSTNGNNSNSGNISNPWATIQYSVDQLSPGDNLYIRGGTYMEKVDLNVSGTAGNRITIQNYNSELVTLSGNFSSTDITMIDIVDQSYITIQGLTITDNKLLDAQGIQISGVCTGIYILNNIISEIDFSSNPNASVNSSTNAQGIIVYGTSGTTAITDLRINENEIKDCLLGYSEALAVNGNVDGFFVMSNYVHDNTNIGIDIIGHENTAPANDQARNGLIKGNIVHDNVSPYATSGGLYVDGGMDLIMENNISYKNGYGIEVGCENINKTTSNITIRNNLVYNNNTAGLAMGGFDFPNTGKVVSCTISGNTFFSNDSDGTFTGELYFSYAEDCVVTSNIFYTTAQNTLAYTELSQPNLDMDHNLFFCPAGIGGLEVSWNGSFYFGYNNYTTGTGNDLNSSFGDPIFTSLNINSPDLHLASNSPAIEAGDPGYTVDPSEVDMDGTARLAGSIIDCGADEYGSICPNTLMVNADPIQDGIYEAIIQVSSSGKVPAMGNVILRAGDEVVLLPNFEVKLNADLHVYIQSCN